MSIPIRFNSTVNYIGKKDQFQNMLDSDLDDLKIFNKSLGQSDIAKLFNAYSLNDLAFINSSLINHWEFSSSLIDSISGLSLFNPINTTFSLDRLGSINSAIYLKKGYLSIPTGIYFKGKF